MTRLSNQDRLSGQPSYLVGESDQTQFDFNGKQYRALDGDTIASALYASGVRVFTRSFKYHRARGLLCVAGNCANCLMTVDGIPNVRACTTRVEAGMRVKHQNAWPSQDRDVLSILDKFDRLMPIGFYYKTFHTPKLLWKIVRPIIRRIAGLGSVPKEPVAITSDHEYRHTEVAVVGGGPAGMSAALAAAESGARVTLVDDQPTLGGHLLYDECTKIDPRDMATESGQQSSRLLAQRIESNEDIEIIGDATAFGLYEGKLLGINQGSSMIRLRANSVVVATGSYETPLTFDRNDLPGVMLATGLQRLIYLYGVKPGKVAIVSTTNDHGYQAALDMISAGLRIVVLTDTRPEFPDHLEAAAQLRDSGVLILPSHGIVRAEGVKRVIGGVVAKLENGQTTTVERQFDADIIAMSGGFQPAAALIHQLGAGSKYEDALGLNVATDLPDGVFAAGDMTGFHDTGIAMLQGQIAGIEAATRPDFDRMDSQLSDYKTKLTEREANYRNNQIVSSHPLENVLGAKQFVCFCEDVTARDITAGVDEGFEDIQTLKRYSTVTMGPCQGKMCHKTFVDIAAQHSGQRVADLGSTTSRPPVKPVSLGTLAGPIHRPTKLTPMDRKHRELGAEMIDSNIWQRPRLYGSAQEEAHAVRNGVGIIDVSTLGKLEVQGKDAPVLLDRLYTHYFSNLRVGRVRYGVLCADNGTIMDDGTVARLAEDRYFVTTSTASVEAIEEWFKWWMAGENLCAHVTNVTSGYGVINVAGPRARETLEKLTDLDLSTDGFRYMRVKNGDVAGVQTLMLRIGFVGETGWELHFPAEYGEFMWDSIMDAGKDYGITPFGTETQRILRLEKIHIIPNQDTDMVSNPIDSGMEWVVKFEKEDFIGRGALLAARDRPMPNRLVGFVMKGDAIPHDGDAVVSGLDPIGRVTSSRLSPTIGKGFGFCWIPTDLAGQGNTIHIKTNGTIYPAEVVTTAFYDPEGKRLRQ